MHYLDISLDETKKIKHHQLLLADTVRLAIQIGNIVAVSLFVSQMLKTSSNCCYKNCAPGHGHFHLLSK